MALKAKGYPVDAIHPQAAIYLTVKIDLVGKTTPDGTQLSDTDAAHQYLLDSGIGILPFSWFGATNYGEWFRISVGTCSQAEVANVLAALEEMLATLN